MLRAACLIIWIVLVPAATAEPLFESDETLNAVLSAPFRQIYREKKGAKRLYHAAHIAWSGENGQTVKVPVRVRTRGKFRRLNCAWPPLRLNFATRRVAGTLFDGQDKLKLVAPCRSGNAAEQDLLQEYLAYRIAQRLGPYSFRTRLLRLSYADSEGRAKPRTSPAFLIESEPSMAARNGATGDAMQRVAVADLDPAQTALIELFQLMISNFDFSTIRGPEGSACCHNSVPIRLPDTGRVVPVPYDFDMSGLVNARYAEPPEQVPVRSVTRRYFTGRCRSDEDWNSASAILQRERDEILAMPASIPGMDERTVRDTQKFLAGFYEILDDPRRFDKEVRKRCR